MAASKGRTAKKNTGSRTKGRAKSTKKSTGARKSQQKKESFIGREVLILGTLAVSILLFLSCMGVGGYVGAFVGDLLFGVCGTAAYLLPFLLFFGVAFKVSNDGNLVASIKVAASVVAVLMLCTLIQLFAVDYDATATAAELYAYGAQRHLSGGAVGGVIASVLHPAVGMAGASILCGILFVICLVVITEHSVVRQVQKGSRRMYDRAVEESARRKEQAQLRRQQRLEEQEKDGSQQPVRRMDRRVSGVARDTTILSDSPAGDIHEVNAPKKSHVVQEEWRAAEEARQEDTGRQETAAVPEEDSSDLPKGKQPFTITGIRVTETDEEEPRALQPHERHIAEELETEGLEDGGAGMDGWEAEGRRPGSGQQEAFQEEEPPVRHGRGRESQAPDSPVSAEDIQKEMDNWQAEPWKEYIFPPLSLLKKGKHTAGTTEGQLMQTAQKLEEILHSFGVNAKVTNVSCGPTVTRYELSPEQGVKVSKIVGLADDIKLNLAAEDIRMEAPIPGKAAVGIEVPNKENTAVMLRDLLESREFLNHPSKLAFAVGKDIAGETVVADIAKMPHLLIAGATGSGKSVCINTIIISLLYHSRPEEVKLIMIDPKVVELSVYNGIPHLYIPVVTDPKKAAGALNWAVAEMMERYQKFAEVNVRDLKGYNAKVDSLPPAPAPEDGKAASGGDGGRPEKMPQIVIIVDELADLMMVAPGEVEDAICRLAQLARAAGIHLIIATQRPSVNVITGLIKANMPSRIAFSVSSGVDSRTILDMNGAEKLLGKGDMLFYPQGYQKPSRIQGAFVSDEEVGKVVEFLAKQQSALQYSEEIEKKVSEVAAAVAGGAGGSSGLGAGPERDAYFIEAGKFIIEKDKASIGMLQRWFKIGFNRAARIMDQLAEAGVVGEEEGTKPRKVLMSMEEFEQYVDEHV